MTSRSFLLYYVNCTVVSLYVPLSLISFEIVNIKRKNDSWVQGPNNSKYED